jgi:hypothetical protein
MKDLYQISESTNLDLVELTKGSNGYPSGISKALDASSLDNFAEVEEIANTYDLEIVKIHQKNGWHFWENLGWINKPISIDSSDFGDDYSEIGPQDEEDFIKSEVKHLLESVESFDQIQSILDWKKEIWEEVQNLEEDEIVITHEGRYYETFKTKSLFFSEDTHNWKIALIEK